MESFVTVIGAGVGATYDPPPLLPPVDITVVVGSDAVNVVRLVFVALVPESSKASYDNVYCPGSDVVVYWNCQSDPEISTIGHTWLVASGLETVTLTFAIEQSENPAVCVHWILTLIVVLSPVVIAAALTESFVYVGAVISLVNRTVRSCDV